jgi:hypothetical protein
LETPGNTTTSTVTILRRRWHMLYARSSSVFHGEASSIGAGRQLIPLPILAAVNAELVEQKS